MRCLVGVSGFWGLGVVLSPSAGSLGAVPYFLSKTLVELPQSLLNATISWASTYWIMGLHGPSCLRGVGE